MKMLKTTLSLIMVFCMLCSLSTGVFAEDVGGPSVDTGDQVMDNPGTVTNSYNTGGVQPTTAQTETGTGTGVLSSNSGIGTAGNGNESTNVINDTIYIGINNAYEAQVKVGNTVVTQDSPYPSADNPLVTVTPAEGGEPLTVSVNGKVEGTGTNAAIDAASYNSSEPVKVVANGGVDSPSGDGLAAAGTNHGNSSTIIMTGDVNSYFGIFAVGYVNDATVEVTGKVDAEKQAIGATSDEGGKAEVTVSGDVTSKNGNGVRTQAGDMFGMGTVEVAVGGKLEAKGTGIDSYSTVDGSSVTFSAGSIEAGGTGINVLAGNDQYDLKGGKTSVTVGDLENVESGDVDAGGDGLKVTYENTGAETDILVTGTLSAGQQAVVVNDSVTEDNLSLTVWKVETKDEDNDGKADDIVSGSSTASNAFTDASINYIIKVEQPKAGGKITTSGTTTRTTGSGENQTSYETAKEGETVTMKVTVKDGYELKGAFNGLDQSKLELIPGEDGNYYIKVPKGGGVYLSVELSEKAKPNNDSNTDPVTVTVAGDEWSDAYYRFNKNVVKQIKAAEKGDTVNVDATGWASFMRMVFEALDERDDVTLVVKYGTKKELTIPAGAGVLDEIGSAQDITFVKLAKLIG